MVTKQGTVLAQAHINFPAFLTQRTRTIILDAWTRGEQNELEENHGVDDIKLSWSPGTYKPDSVTDEYEDLASRSTTPWAGLVVTSVAQMVYVSGVRRKGAKDNLKVWDTWQRNEWDAWQIALHRSVIAHGVAFATVMPSEDPFTKEKMARMQAHSAEKMSAFYQDAQDQWPMFAIWAEPITNVLGVRKGWRCKFYDETAVHDISCENDGRELADWTYISHETHPFPVPPVVRYANNLDLNGRATGAVEPIIPMLRRVDQGTFDRLITQRFGAWKIRYIAGMAKPTRASEAQAEKMRLRIEDLLIAEDKDTKFGTLDATEIQGFLDADSQDLRALSAITQTPPHHLLGVSSNLQAEALAAAEAGLLRKAADFRTICGESHEKLLRLTAWADGNMDEAKAFDMEVQWMDTESRSLVQTVNALALAATGLQIPLEMLWEKLPWWTDQMSERALELAKSGDSIDAVLAELESEQAADAAKKMAKAVPPTPVAGGPKGVSGAKK